MVENILKRGGRPGRWGLAEKLKRGELVTKGGGALKRGGSGPPYELCLKYAPKLYAVIVKCDQYVQKH